MKGSVKIILIFLLTLSLFSFGLKPGPTLLPAAPSTALCVAQTSVLAQAHLFQEAPWIEPEWWQLFTILN